MELSFTKSISSKTDLSPEWLSWWLSWFKILVSEESDQSSLTLDFVRKPWTGKRINIMYVWYNFFVQNVANMYSNVA